jgi:hypothetical protein
MGVSLAAKAAAQSRACDTLWQPEWMRCAHPSFVRYIQLVSESIAILCQYLSDSSCIPEPTRHALSCAQACASVMQSAEVPECTARACGAALANAFERRAAAADSIDRSQRVSVATAADEWVNTTAGGMATEANDVHSHTHSHTHTLTHR